MINEPLISVIIPTINRANCIENAINSVVHQTYKNWELIIIDGSPNDETHKTIIPYLQDPRINYIFLEKINSSESLNYGIKNSHGIYIALLDDDDEFIENKLQIQLSEMIIHNVDFSISNCIKVYDGKSVSPVRFQKSFLIKKEDFFSSKFHLSHTHMMFSASIREDCLFDPLLPASDDFDLLARMITKHKLLFVKEPLAYISKSVKRRRISNDPTARINTIEQLLIKLKTYDWTNDEKLILKNNLTLHLGFWQLMDRKYKQGRFNIHNALPGISSSRRRKYISLILLSYIPPLFKLIKFIAEQLWSLSSGRIKI
jgi:glycosyltransferase involved in cell wall biosynthesis